MRIITIILFCSLISKVFGQSFIEDYVTAPSALWKFKMKKGNPGSPVAVGNSVIFGGCDSTLYALLLSSGKTLWKIKTSGEIRSAPVIQKDTVFFNGGDGHLYAISVSNGKIFWKTFIGNEMKYDFADYHQSSPVLHNENILVGSGDGFMNSIRRKDGKINWRFKTGDVIHNKPAFNNEKVFFGSFDGYVYCLDVTNGKELWKFKTIGHRYFPKGEVQGSPAVFGNSVIIGARDYNVYAIDQNTGTGLWNKSFSDGWCLVNNVYDSVLYTAGADERILISIDPQTGREHWRKKMDFLVFGNLAFSRSFLYAGTTLGKLHAIDKSNGKTLWTINMDGYLTNRLKYFKEDDSYRDDIYSIIKSNEQFLDVEFELGGIFSTPLVLENHIVITAGDGTVVCYKR